jgi:hypothetical protein
VLLYFVLWYFSHDLSHLQVKVNEITSVEENVWLSGTIRSDGKTWVINSKTYELIAVWFWFWKWF